MAGGPGEADPERECRATPSSRRAGAPRPARSTSMDAEGAHAALGRRPDRVHGRHRPQRASSSRTSASLGRRWELRRSSPSPRSISPATCSASRLLALGARLGAGRRPARALLACAVGPAARPRPHRLRTRAARPRAGGSPSSGPTPPPTSVADAVAPARPRSRGRHRRLATSLPHRRTATSRALAVDALTLAIAGPGATAAVARRLGCRLIDARSRRGRRRPLTAGAEPPPPGANAPLTEPVQKLYSPFRRRRYTALALEEHGMRKFAVARTGRPRRARDWQSVAFGGGDGTRPGPVRQGPQEHRQDGRPAMPASTRSSSLVKQAGPAPRRCRARDRSRSSRRRTRRSRRCPRTRSRRSAPTREALKRVLLYHVVVGPLPGRARREASSRSRRSRARALKVRVARGRRARRRRQGHRPGHQGLQRGYPRHQRRAHPARVGARPACGPGD